jgi:hypothetical protein
MKTEAFTLLRRSGRYVLAVLCCAALSVLAVSVHADNGAFFGYEDEAQQRQERAVQQAFDVMQAIGTASNTGEGRDESLRQACALLQQQSDTMLRSALDERLGGQVLIEDTKVGSLLYAHGHITLSNAVSSACAALSGQGGEFDVGFSPEGLSDMALGLAIDEGIARLGRSGLPFTGRLEVSGNLLSAGGAGWEVLSVQPLWSDAAAQNHLLAQVSLNYVEGRQGYADGHTMNAGLVYRRLSDDRRIVYGLNAFLDHAREMNHNRMSIGADAQTSMLGVSANSYFPLSSWKSVDAYTEERAARGFDIELQGRMPEFPSWQANVKGYRWSSNVDMEQEQTYGYDVGLQWQPVNALIWDAGVRDEHDADPEFHAQMRLVYNFGEPLHKMWERPAALMDVSERVYDKVRRENSIRVEQRIKDSAYVTVQQTIGANTARLADGTSVSLQTNQDLPRPFTVQVSAAGGSVARLVFRDGGVLTIGAGSEVRVEAELITLISGSFQYVSGATNVTINVPGGVVTLLGTDVDVSSDGTTSVLRVRDGQAIIAGAASGSTTLSPGGAAGSVNGVVGAALATTDPVYINHTDEVSAKIDRVAAPLVGAKVAPYNVEIPTLGAPATSAGQPVDLTLKFNAPVTVSALPQLVLDIGGTTRSAVYASGSGSDELVFTYILQAGDVGTSLATVQSLDLNGGTITGNGKSAVITIADTVVNLTGSGDVITPTGYSVAFTTDPIGGGNYTAAALQITSAEVGTSYDYTVTSDNGGTPVTGTGAVTSATQDITGIDLSGLGDGTLTVSLTLTDAGSNVGAVATDTVAKDVITLGLDFVGGSYSLNGTSYAAFTDIPGASFTRAAPATTYAEDSAGNLIAFSANTPRVTDKGLLLEGGSENLIRNSQSFSAGGWGAGRLIVNDNQSDPLGGNTAAELEATGGGDPIFAQSVSTGNPSNRTFTFSFWMRAGVQNGGEVLCAKFFSYGTTGTELANSESISLTSDWKRYTYTRTFPSGMSSTFTIFRVDPYDCTGGTNIPSAGSSVFIWGAQLEEGSFASSYIPTSGSAVTRNADVMSADISALDLLTGYSVLFEGGINAVEGPFDRAFQLDNANNDNRHNVFYNSGGNEYRYSLVDNNVLQATSINSVAVLGDNFRAASRIAPNNFNVAYSGAADTTDVSANYTEPSKIWFAASGGGTNGKPASMHIREFNLFDVLKTDAQLDTLSTP